ncbi:hypothetical protein BH11ARM2_BH11ARM2_02800 [soil metagenome]
MTQDWSLTAIDSCLERGDLKDWRELFGAARQEDALASRVHARALATEEAGTRNLAIYLLEKWWPDLKS